MAPNQPGLWQGRRAKIQPNGNLVNPVMVFECGKGAKAVDARIVMNPVRSSGLTGRGSSTISREIVGKGLSPALLSSVVTAAYFSFGHPIAHPQEFFLDIPDMCLVCRDHTSGACPSGNKEEDNSNQPAGEPQLQKS